jgi:hypothetical protein
MFEFVEKLRADAVAPAEFGDAKSIRVICGVRLSPFGAGHLYDPSRIH